MDLIFNVLISLSGIGLIFSGWHNGSWLMIVGIALVAMARPLSRHVVKRIDPTAIQLEQAAAERAATRAAKQYQAQNQLLNRDKIGFQYFKATFLFAGYISQADGTVCDKETALLDEQVARLQLTHVQIQAASDYFNQGRERGFDPKKALHDLLTWCKDTPILCESFLQTQFRFVTASDSITAKELAIIEQLTETVINYLPQASNHSDFLNLLANFRHVATLQAEQKAKTAMDAKKRERDARRAAEEQAKLEKERQKKLTPTQRKLQLAFITLGIKSSATQAEIKRAYREQIKRNHPDYLLAQGYPEALLAEATDKSAAINKAYRLIKTHYGFR